MTDQTTRIDTEAARAKYDAARKALFELEESLGQTGTAPRRDVYRLRCELGLVGERIRSMEKSAEAAAAFRAPLECRGCSGRGKIAAPMGRGPDLPCHVCQR